MSDDFVTRLRLQLREAAERQERRRAPARAVDAARGVPGMSLRPVVALVAIAASLFVAVFAVTTLRPEHAADAPPRIVDRFSVGDSLGEITFAFGSAWVDDPNAGQMLRIDPRTRRVVARIPVGASARIAAGTDGVWAVGVSAAAGPLLRIDPATNRIVQRVRLTLPGGIGVAPWRLLVSPHHIWVLGHSGAVHVDPGTGRITATTPSIGFDGALTDSDLWLQQAQDGRRLLRLDPSTGARRAALQMQAPGAPVVVGRALLTVGDQQAARLDPSTGRALWRTAVRAPYVWTAARGRLWIEGRISTGPKDRVCALAQTGGDHGCVDAVGAIDPATGRITSVPTGEFGGAGLAGVGSDLWLTTPGGRVLVVRP